MLLTNRFSFLTYAALLFGLCVSQVACTKDQVTATFGALVNAAATYEDTVAPQYKPIVDAVVLNCIDPSLTIIGGSTTGLSKAEAIGQACVPSVAALSNNPQLSALALALNSFLDSVKTLTAEAQSTPAGAFAFASSPKAAKVDQKKLKQLRKQVDALKLKVSKR